MRRRAKEEEKEREKRGKLGHTSDFRTGVGRRRRGCVVSTGCAENEEEGKIPKMRSSGMGGRKRSATARKGRAVCEDPCRHSEMVYARSSAFECACQRR
jgi:hypothetical protein